MASHRTGTNYYEILEVSNDAPQNEIHRAYQKAKQTYSQDNPALYSMFSKEEARELIVMIEEAYGVLGNQGVRKAYDDGLASHHSSAPEDLKTASSMRDIPEQAALSHAALPDFSPPVADQDLDEVKPVVPVRETATASSVSGQGRTSLSSYKVDDAFEAEIAAREDWDGSFIQRVRTYKNISMEKLSDATRVSRSYLSAIETSDYASLPAPVFVRGFVVQTARILGLNDAKVASSFMKILKAAPIGKK